MSFTKLLFSVGCLAVALAASPVARAQECETTVDCRKGFTCVIVPSAEPTRGAAPDCATGGDCPLVAPPPAADAGTVTTGYCAPGSCTTVDDCGPNMICHTETYPSCPGATTPACPPNSKCDPGPSTPAPACTTTTVSTCAYKWQLQCNVDTDCGAGFTCTPSVSVGCSGGGSAGTSGTTSSGPSNSGTGGAASSAGVAVPPDSHCTTTTSFPGSCTPNVTSCTATQDCPADWTCAPAPVAVSNQSGSGTAAAADIAPGAPVPSVPIRPAAMTCTSPLGTTGVAVDSTGGKGQTTSGGAGGTSGGTTEPRASGTSGSSPSAGCALGGRPSGSLAFAALALLGLALSRRRR